LFPGQGEAGEAECLAAESQAQEQTVEDQGDEQCRAHALVVALDVKPDSHRYSVSQGHHILMKKQSLVERDELMEVWSATVNAGRLFNWLCRYAYCRRG
jgi:hypothetical protein